MKNARTYVALLFAATPAVIAGCATTAAPAPNDARAVYCVSPDADCSREAVQACPQGYKTLDRQSWAVGHRDRVTDEIVGAGFGSSPKAEDTPRTERTKLVIACSPAT
jgi:hypothetical protein